MIEGIKFIHLREYTDSWAHEQEVSIKGGTTVAFKENEDGSVSFAIAKCSPKDNFCRRFGREASMGRLLKNKHVVTLTKEQVGESAYDAILQRVS